MQSGCQLYVNGSVEAVSFYQRAFNLSLGINFKDADGDYEHASLMFGEREILAIAENKGGTSSPYVRDNKWPAMSFNCSGLGTKEAVQHAYDVLSEGAFHNQNPNGPGPLPWSELCFYLVDKYGVHWWVAI